MIQTFPLRGISADPKHLLVIIFAILVQRTNIIICQIESIHFCGSTLRVGVVLEFPDGAAMLICIYLGEGVGVILGKLREGLGLSGVVLAEERRLRWEYRGGLHMIILHLWLFKTLLLSWSRICIWLLHLLTTHFTIGYLFISFCLNGVRFFDTLSHDSRLRKTMVLGVDCGDTIGLVDLVAVEWRINHHSHGLGVGQGGTSHLSGIALPLSSFLCHYWLTRLLVGIVSRLEWFVLLFCTNGVNVLIAEGQAVSRLGGCGVLYELVSGTGSCAVCLTVSQFNSFLSAALVTTAIILPANIILLL